MKRCIAHTQLPAPPTVLKQVQESTFRGVLSSLVKGFCTKLYEENLKESGIRERDLGEGAVERQENPL